MLIPLPGVWKDVRTQSSGELQAEVIDYLRLRLTVAGVEVQKHADLRVVEHVDPGHEVSTPIKETKWRDLDSLAEGSLALVVFGFHQFKPLLTTKTRGKIIVMRHTRLRITEWDGYGKEALE